MTKNYLGFWAPCTSWIFMTKKSGKIKSKAALWICTKVTKEFRRTRENDLRRNWEFFSTQTLPVVKWSVSAVPLNRRNCQSLEGKELKRQWREHQQDYAMTWAGQGKAGGDRESEQNSSKRAKTEQGTQWSFWKHHHVQWHQCARNDFKAHHWVNCVVLYGRRVPCTMRSWNLLIDSLNQFLCFLSYRVNPLPQPRGAALSWGSAVCFWEEENE